MLADSVEELPIGLPQGSFPKAFVALGDRVLFEAESTDDSHEVWSTDGTKSGTFPLRGSAESPYGISQALGVVGGRAVFSDRFGTLWSSDGGHSGAISLGKQLSGDSSAQLGDQIYFASYDDVADVELFVTDGTVGGTRLVKDLQPYGGSYPHRVTRAGNEVLFFASDALYRTKLWRTDGTSAGTVVAAELAADFDTFVVHGDPVAVGTRLYFMGSSSAQSGLWRYDTQQAQAKFLFAAHQGVLHAVGNHLILQVGNQVTRVDDVNGTLVTLGTFWELGMSGGAIGGHLYFTGGQDLSPYVLWKTDGQSVSPVATLNTAFSTLTSVTDIGSGRGFLSVSSEGRVTEFWKTDGTPQGTVQIMTVPSMYGDLAAIGSHAYFGGTDIAGVEPWTFNADTGVARRLADIRPGFYPASGRVTGTTDSLLIPDQWSAYDAFSMSEIDRTTHQVRRVGLPAFPQDSKIVMLGELRLFVDYYGTLFAMNEAGDYQTLIAAGAGELTVIGSRAYFRYAGGLGSTDGTPEGTRVEDSRSIGLMAPGPDGMVFVSTDYYSPGIYLTDGTYGGTRQLLTIADPWQIDQLIVAPSGAVYFQQWISSYQLCAVDPERDELVLLRESYDASRIGLLGSRLLAASPAGYLLSDGTASTTSFTPWTIDGYPSAIRSNDTTSFVLVNHQVWAVSDLGAVLVHAALYNQQAEGETALLEGRLYFTTHHDVGLLRLWRTDGTAAGTEPLMVLTLDGDSVYAVDRFVAFDGQLFFNAYTNSATRTLRYVPDYGSPRLIDQPVALHDGQGRAFSVETGSGDQIRSALPGDVRAISLRFDQHVDVRSADLSVVGSETGAYGVASFQYDAATFTARWTLNRPIDQPDQITLTLSDRVRDPNGTRLDGDWINPTSLDATRASVASGDWQEGGAFVFRFTVLPGDANRDNRVDGQDYQRWSDLFGTIGSGAIDEADFNGDGASSGDDYLLWADAFGTDFTVPAASVEAGARAAGETLAPRRSIGTEDARWTASAHDQVLAAVWVAGELAEDSLGAPGVRRVVRSSLRTPGNGWLAPVRERGL